jgi:hypothetical protein
MDLSLDTVTRLLPDLAGLGTEVVLLSGGEPLLNPQWPLIAELLRSRGLQVWLLTSGLSLAKHANRVAELFDSVTVSLDGTNPATYAAIRGLDAFDKVCEGIRASAGQRAGTRPAGYRTKGQLPRVAGLRRTRKAIGRTTSLVPCGRCRQSSCVRSYLGRLQRTGLRVPTTYPTCRIASLPWSQLYARRLPLGLHRRELPASFRRIQQYFAAVQRARTHSPSVRCNAPEFSAVVNRDRRSPTVFLHIGTCPRHSSNDGLSARALDADAMTRVAQRPSPPERTPRVQDLRLLHVARPSRVSQLLDAHGAAGSAPAATHEHSIDGLEPTGLSAKASLGRAAGAFHADGTCRQ